MYSQPGKVLNSLCLGAHNLFIAAPYIKADALSKVLAGVSPAASLVCITRWSPHDLAAGASDPECRTIVTERRGSFRLHPSLHAKYYRIDNVVLIGSANLTASAMGWSPQPNLEILCRPGDDFDACTFQQHLLEGAREISEAEFTVWEAIRNIGAQYNSAITHDQPMFDTWRPATRDPRHLKLAYRDREDEIASYDEKQAAQRDIQSLQIPAGLTDDQVREWISACLLATPFTNSVIRLHGRDTLVASRLVAAEYNLGTPEARRAMETVQNWLAFFAPEIVTRNLGYDTS